MIGVERYCIKSRHEYLYSVKKTIKSIINKFGYALVARESIIPKDLRGKVDNPWLAKYAARKQSFVVNADAEKCIAMYCFSCEKTGNNPMVKVINEYLQQGDIIYSDSELEDFYNKYTPKNVTEMFSLEGKLHNDLIELPADFIVLPWENSNMNERKKFCEKHVREETSQRGNELSLQHGYGCIGPISKERGELELKTLVELTKSIKAGGYIRGSGPQGDIKASVLTKGKEYRFFINDGNHRIAVLSALGYESIPIRVLPSSIPAFIHRTEADFWPSVRNGLYTKIQALKIFDTIFNGDGRY